MRAGEKKAAFSGALQMSYIAELAYYSQRKFFTLALRMCVVRECFSPVDPAVASGHAQVLTPKKVNYQNSVLFCLYYMNL